MSAAEIDFAGEGGTDSAVARRLILSAGGHPGTDYTQRAQPRGKEALGKRLAGYNLGAKFGRPILVLRDLDHDTTCPGDLLARLLPERQPGCLLRIAVRSVEAWLMADSEGLKQAASLRSGLIPAAPENLNDPKRTMIDILRGTRSNTLRNHLDFGGMGPTRQLLGAWTANFVRNDWSPERALASGRAPSLERCFMRISEIVKQSASGR